MMKRVLIVDDEEDFLRLAKLNLEESGDYEILTLSSANNIVSQARAFKPDIILMDMLMPGIKGIEACEMLSGDPVGERIPIIMLSALDKDVDKLKAFKAGVADYLVKPVDKDLLIAKIEKWVRRTNGK